jgi:hypothetical protein
MNADEKARRMEIRREFGSRPMPAARGAPDMSVRYLVSHACFTCRKSFKLAPRIGGDARCPNCSGPMFEMGRSFKAPPLRDVEQWAKVQALYEAGFRFFTYGEFDCAPLPSRLSEVAAFLCDNPDHPLRVARPTSSSDVERPGGAA